jgi:tetratricopeptide (TPR) repeat protein
VRGVVWAALIGIALAISSGAAADPPAAQSRQAAFDAAQAAFDKSDWKRAIAGFTDVLASMPNASRGEAVIRARLAEALTNDGRTDEAQTEAARAVAELRALSAGPDADLAYAYLTLGDALKFNFANDQAIEAYRQARASAAGPDAAIQSAQAASGLIDAAMVTHPDLAASTADALIASGRAFRVLPRDDQAQIYSLRARAELNRGDPAKARPFVDEALALSGTMDAYSLNTSRVTARGDAALVYTMLHNDAAAQDYLAHSGAGYMPKNGWADGADLPLLACGPDLRPEDVAVVQFAIAEDGRTLGATPVYASRAGDMGIIFARAVRTWRWSPTAVAKLNGFWRSAIRVQLGCMPHSNGATAAAHAASLVPAAGPPGLGATAPAEAKAANPDCHQLSTPPVVEDRSPENDREERWAFEGWLKVSVDVSAKGEITIAHTLISYPPFVFASLPERLTPQVHFRPGTIDGVPVSCSGQVLSFAFEDK